MNPYFLALCCFFLGLSVGLAALYYVVVTTPELESNRFQNECSKLMNEGYSLCKPSVGYSIREYNSSIILPSK